MTFASGFVITSLLAVTNFELVTCDFSKGVFIHDEGPFCSDIPDRLQNEYELRNASQIPEIKIDNLSRTVDAFFRFHNVEVAKLKRAEINFTTDLTKHIVKGGKNTTFKISNWSAMEFNTIRRIQPAKLDQLESGDVELSVDFRLANLEVFYEGIRLAAGPNRGVMNVQCVVRMSHFVLYVEISSGPSHTLKKVEVEPLEIGDYHFTVASHHDVKIEDNMIRDWILEHLLSEFESTIVPELTENFLLSLKCFNLCEVLSPFFNNTV